MIAPAAANTITDTIEWCPCDASTPNAISAVSPGSGSPNDSSITTTKSSGSPCATKKWVIERSVERPQPLDRENRREPSRILGNEPTREQARGPRLDPAAQVVEAERTGAPCARASPEPLRP